MSFVTTYGKTLENIVSPRLNRFFIIINAYLFGLNVSLALLSFSPDLFSESRFRSGARFCEALL